MFLHQVGAKAVMARRNRGVRSEDHFPGDPRHRLVKTSPFLLHAGVNRFEHCKAAVSLIQMQDAGSDSHRPEGAEAANSQKQFLANADAPVAAIQTGSELAVFRIIRIPFRLEGI